MQGIERVSVLGCDKCSSARRTLYRPYVEGHVSRSEDFLIDLSLKITGTTTLHTIAVSLITQIYHIYSTYHVFKVYVPVQRGNTLEYMSTRVEILASIEYSYTCEYLCSKRVLV